MTMPKKLRRNFDDFVAFTEKVAYEEYSPELQSHMTLCQGWREQHHFHASIITRAFCDGILRASPWDDNFVPSRINGVMKWIAFMTQKTFGNKRPVIVMSVHNAVRMVREWAMEHPDFRGWASRMDLEAVFQSMGAYLMDYVDATERERKR